METTTSNYSVTMRAHDDREERSWEFESREDLNRFVATMRHAWTLLTVMERQAQPNGKYRWVRIAGL